MIKILSKSKDGGPESKVWAYWLIEIKWLFSIAILRFDEGTRPVFHSHAFNSISWLIKGKLTELLINGKINVYRAGIWPIFTFRDTFHQVSSENISWVLTFRGPWAKTWKEWDGNQESNLTSGRKLV